jgi:2'-5' RNA ligase
LSVRTFVALELSERLKEGILALAEEFRARGIWASWAKRPTLHLTLKFLGDVEETELPEVVAAVERASSGVSTFDLETARLGAFPSPRRPRVLWLGVAPCDELFALHAALDEELAALGFQRERRRFHPHVTIGRMRDPRAESVQAMLDELVAPKETVAVEEVRVMRSTLRPEGALHELVEAIPLDGS